MIQINASEPTIPLQIKATSVASQVQSLLSSPMPTGQTFKMLAKLVGQLREEDRAEAYRLVEAKFRSVEHAPGVLAWIHRGDLLDAIDVLVEQGKGVFAPLQVKASGVKPGWAAGAVPLLPYGKIKANLKRAENKTFSSLAEISSTSDVVAELAATARIVEKATKTRDRSILDYIISLIFKIVSRILTRVLGIAYNIDMRFLSLNRIAKFSVSMGIASAEVIRRKISKEGYIDEYRGPTFLFGNSLHAFKKVDSWFARDLTPQARALYTQKAELKEQSIVLKYGLKHENVASNVVIANADSRIRMHTIAPGGLGTAYELTGKVLNEESEIAARAKNDHPVYYNKKYLFTARNLFGRRQDDPMEIRTLPSSVRGAACVKAAQHELLAGMYRALDRRGVIQVIQRLAPADVHNYVAPLGGTPLSNLEAAKFLSTLEGATAEEQAHYSELIKVFQDQEPVSTIDIHGTLDSVATTAILNQSSILSQNDRKVMLFKHEDGSFSVHVFIGATGVNRVNVRRQADNLLERGKQQGDMRFGTDAHKGKLRLGEGLGTFPINGSTVISYYLPTDFALYPKLEEAKEKMVYGTGVARTEVEVKVQMGDPLLLKVEVRIAELLEEGDPSDFYDAFSETLDERAQKILEKLPGYSAELNALVENSKALRDKVLNMIKQRLATIVALRGMVKSETCIETICKTLKEMDVSACPEHLCEIRDLLRRSESELLLKEKLQLIKFRKELEALTRSS